MDQNPSTLTKPEAAATQHGMLIVWGHFARSIGLLERLSHVPIRQKTAWRTPQEKLVEFQIGLLAGIEYLTDLSEGAVPLANDVEVAAAWGLQRMADASGVSRTLWASDDETVRVLEMELHAVGQPFLARAVSDLRQRDEVLVLDADLTGRPVSATSRTFPGAAFGYMDGEVRLGYQLAQICLQTHLFGRQWLSAQHHPGDTVSAPCLLSLIQEAERRLACHPRRRTELLQQRMEVCEQEIRQVLARVGQKNQRVAVKIQRMEHLCQRIQQAESQIEIYQAEPVSTRQTGRYSKLSRLQTQVAGWYRQLGRAQAQLAYARAVAERQRQRLQAAAQVYRSEHQRLQVRYDQFCQENARQPNPPRCKIRLDAGFASGENLTELIELGYDVDTKSANPAVLQALRSRVTVDTTWTTVGRNAEMYNWPQKLDHVLT